MTGFLTLENPILPLTLENPVLSFGRSFITSKSLFKCFLSTGFRNMCIALGTVFLVSFNVGLTVVGLKDCFIVESVYDSIKGSVRSASTIPVFKPEIQLLLATKNLFRSAAPLLSTFATLYVFINELQVTLQKIHFTN